MNNFLEELKHYFATTPQAVIDADWAKSAEFDKVGPSIDEFLQNCKHINILSVDPDIGYSSNIVGYSPKFTSGFFLIKYFIKWKKQLSR